MSLDGMAIRALVTELHSQLEGGRIDKITQPNLQTILFHIRKDGKTLRLLASINPHNVRLALTEKKLSAAAHPPLFCMVLRKHLASASIHCIRQLAWERIIAIDFVGHNDIGDVTHITLLSELMGKSSNIILLDSSNQILDAARRVGPGANRYRQIQPGLLYVPPPPQDKQALEDITEFSLSQAIIESSPTQTLRKTLLSTIAGVGPQTADNLLYAASIDPWSNNEFLGEIDYQRLYHSISELQNRVEKQQWVPTLVMQEGEPKAFAPFPLVSYASEMETLSSMSELLETYYGHREQSERLKQKRTSLKRIVEHEITRCEKKMHLQLDKIYESESIEPYRLYGELLTANLHQIRQGTEAIVANYYEPDAPPMKIKLDPTKSPNENAQWYFNRYNRAKKGAIKAQEQAKRTRQELEYLDSINNAIDQAVKLTDLEDIRQELEEAAYVKKRSNSSSNKKQSPAQPMHIKYQGYDIYIGKNNRQNDYLTTKLARGKDLWLHTKEIHGAHVIIRHQHEKEGFPDEVVELAAELAAWFSKGRHSAHVPVDMTLKKYVHKPNGARPGMVIYTDQKTVHVTPNEVRLRPYLFFNADEESQ